MSPFAALLLAWILLRSKLRGWQDAGGLFGLALIGQTATLRLTHAGPIVGYHHLTAPARAADWAWALVLVIQAALVLGLLRREGPALGAWLRRHLPGARGLLVVAAMGLASAKISRPMSASLAEFVLATAIELLGLATLALAAKRLPEPVLAAVTERAERWFGPGVGGEPAPEPGGPDRFAWSVAGASALLAALLAVLVYERMPHVPDEVVYLLHARYLAEGLFALPAPPVPGAFDLDLMLLMEDGRWVCPVPPGWPFVLAVGAFVGLPWLVNPALGGLTILAVYAFVREVAPRRAARLAVGLLAVSPWFVFLNMSLMTHPLTLLCEAVAALGVARARRTGSALWTLAGGAAIGVIATVRPLEGLVVAVALGLWSIGLGGARLRWGAIATLVASTAAVGALTLLYNARVTGDPAKHPIMLYVDRVYGPGKNDLGFGPEKGLGWGGLDPWPGHTPFQAAVNGQFNLFAIDAELFGWLSGSLLLVWFWLAAGTKRRLDRALATFCAAIVLANSLYWFSGGPDFGARYWYLVLLPLVLLTVRGLEELERRFDSPARAHAVVAALVAFALVSWVPWRAVDKYRGYRGIDGGARRLAERVDFGRSVVFVAGERHPDYAAASVLNPLELDGRADATLWAWDRDAEVRERVIEHFGDRAFWFVEGPSRTGAGFEVRAGPLDGRGARAFEWPEPAIDDGEGPGG